MEYLSPILMRLLIELPLLLVWLAGIGLALARWRAHPRVSLLVTLACAISLVATVLATPLMILPMALREHGWAVTRIGFVMSAVGLLLTIASASAWILVLAAVFSGRKPAPAAPLPAEIAPPAPAP